QMKFDETSTQPIFLQVAELIEDMILQQTLKEEDQIFSTNQLAQTYNINPATARKGFSILTDEGILYKKRGLGMYVSSGALTKIREKRRREFLNDFIKKLMTEAEKLGIKKSELIEMIESYKEEKK
ncbi:MAG TPA: GntR family transcriptional regulator, partial [Petrotogaceae bacterium]|nr:GntR family transcriptional regulator [Petrotogaceae bacterium]